jgi:hypothetical protein
VKRIPYAENAASEGLRLLHEARLASMSITAIYRQLSKYWVLELRAFNKTLLPAEPNRAVGIRLGRKVHAAQKALEARI